jgi:ubiquinone/menaquinone biosynthesis C-methylase UbiE
MTDFDEEAKNWDANPLRVVRAKAVAAAIQAALPLTPSMRALEYGSGTGLLSFALRPWLGPITLADNSPGMLAVVAEKIAAAGTTNLRPLQLDLATDPAPAERFQLIYSLMTLHHIADTGKILRDFYALLDPGGWVCVADLDREDGSFHEPGFAGHPGFDRGALAEKARQAGLTHITFSTVFHMPKVVAGRKKDFPVFLMTARRAARGAAQKP